ncbi:hypothetical protein niasHS_010041 [Heterodera schachtii]|uniref:Uncharacterized protein n=1 Tax=Heterodera schachtii TaxID=97005 RepID=A0ABD2J0R6_HETSC
MSFPHQSMDLEMDVHSLEKALVLRFLVGEQKQRKIVQLNGLNERSDTAAVARLVLDQCQPLVPSDRISELERLVFYLQKRHNPNENSDSLVGMEIHAKMDDLESYMELLYEEGEPKQRGVAMLAELVRHVEALQLAQIVENEQLMGALIRIWREDSRKNFELAIHLAQLFRRLSQFAPFHPTLSHLKIGLLSVQTVDFELGRWELWREQTHEKEEKERLKWEYAMRKQDQLIAVVLNILLNLADDLRTEHKMLRKGLLPTLFKCLDHRSSPQLLTVAVKFLWKLSQFSESQQQIANTAGSIDRLVSLLAPPLKSAVSECCGGVGSPLPLSSSSPSDFLGPLFSLLFNCSFEPSSRRCMVAAGLVSLLAPHISENDVALALMYQLSIVDDAKAMIAFTDCIPTLLRLLFSDSRPPSDGDGRPKKETAEGQRRKRSLLVKSLLVNIVLEKRNAQLLCGSEGQGLDSLMAFALENEGGDVLAMKGPTREMFTKWVPQLLENAVEKAQGDDSNNNDNSPLNSTSFASSIFALECLAICALLPNANWAQLEDSHSVVAFLAQILKQSQQSERDETKKSMHNTLDRRKGREHHERGEEEEKGKERKKGTITDEVLLQIVQLCGTIAGHSLEMAERVEKHLLPLVISTLNNRQDDDEIVLQCVFVFLSLLAHGGEMAKRICQQKEEIINQRKSKREIVVGLTKPTKAAETVAVVPLLLLNLMHDKNTQIRALSEQTLERVAEVNAHWRERIREARFRWHNAQWLEMVETTTDALHRSAVVDHLTTMAISSDVGGDGTPFHRSNGEVALLTDGGHVLDSEQVLSGTEF